MRLSHLYERVYPLVRTSVRPSVGPSVSSYFQNIKMKVFLHVYHQGGPGTSPKCRIASLQECYVRWFVHLQIMLKKVRKDASIS